MIKKLPTLTIGIAALNEADNLRRLIPTLLKELPKKYKLTKILILSDGSTDHTFELAKSMSHLPVEFVMGQKQLGKPERVNQIFSRTTSDVLIIVDADIVLETGALTSLSSPLDPKLPMMSSGIARPLPPHNLVEQVASAGVAIWTQVRSQIPKNTVYNSEGMIRAFTKPLYKHLRFPRASNIEDIYPYLYCQTKGWPFIYVDKATVSYHLPSTWHDYRSQQRRYHAIGAERQYFSQTILDRAFFITSTDKLKALFSVGPKNPLYTLIYLLFSLYVRVDLYFKPASYDHTWDVLESTKRFDQ